MAELRLLAWPAGHSLSPVMHAAALTELGLDHTYRAVAVPPHELPAAVAALREPEVLGANVTVPHKEAVLKLLDSLSPAARAIGAVNTISRSGSELAGDNTDVHGFKALLEAAGVSLSAVNPPRVVVLGAGGAARAALWVLADGARTVLVNRTLSRAEALAADFSGHVTVTAVADGADDRLLRGADVVVNTTSVGMERDGEDPDESPLGAAELPAGAVVIDMVYRPQLTRLLKDAQAQGLETVGGLEMLVSQGAESLRIWTGQEPPLPVMRAAAQAALSAA